MGKRPQTDPTTLSGKQGDLGGGGELELLEKNPLRRTFPGDTRVGSKFQKNQGILTTLQNLNPPLYGNAVVIDPTDPDWIISIGGQPADDEGDPSLGSVKVQSYNIKYDYWDEDRYPDITDSTFTYPSSLNSGEAILYMPVAGVVDGEVIVTGGQWSDIGPTNREVNDEIFTLDADYGEWGKLNSTLNTPAFEAGYSVYDGELYIFGGDDGDSVTSGVQSVDPQDDTVTSSYTDLPYPLDQSTYCPVVDGEVYIMGSWEGAPDDGFISYGTPLFTYNFKEDSWSEKSEVDTFIYDGDDEASNGFLSGVLKEYNGNLVAIDGYNYFDEKDISYYSIENDEWVGRDKPDLSDGSNPWHGTQNGVLIDGVIYMPGTGNDNESFWAYIPEKDPFGDN